MAIKIDETLWSTIKGFAANGFSMGEISQIEEYVEGEENGVGIDRIERNTLNQMLTTYKKCLDPDATRDIKRLATPIARPLASTGVFVDFRESFTGEVDFSFQASVNKTTSYFFEKTSSSAANGGVRYTMSRSKPNDDRGEPIQLLSSKDAAAVERQAIDFAIASATVTGVATTDENNSELIISVEGADYQFSLDPSHRASFLTVGDGELALSKKQSMQLKAKLDQYITSLVKDAKITGVVEDAGEHVESYMAITTDQAVQFFVSTRGKKAQSIVLFGTPDLALPLNETHRKTLKAKIDEYWKDPR